MDLISKYRPYGISVTDLSGQLWCEKQVEFSLTIPKVRTGEMQKGGEVHEAKEAELYEMVNVTPKTREDRMLLKLNNNITTLEGLLESGVAREVNLWGIFGELKVSGIADELSLSDAFEISETKTRRSLSMPRPEQVATTRFQLMAYRELAAAISSGRYGTYDFLKRFQFTVSSSASPEFVKQHEELGQSLEPNVSKAAQEAFSLFAKLPPASKLKVAYEHQGTGKLIGKEEFEFDRGFFNGHCSKCEEFWLGKRGARPTEHSWKCEMCQYKEKCKGILS